MSVSQQARVSTVIELPMAQAWEKLQDFSQAHNYVPGLTDTQIVSEQSRGAGAHRRVYSGKRYLEETISDWREGSGFTIRLHKGEKPMPPFKQAEFVYQLSEESDRQTLVELTLCFTMPLGGLGRFLGSRVVTPGIHKQLIGVAAGMKHFYETGEPASNKDRARLAGAVKICPAGES